MSYQEITDEKSLETLRPSLRATFKKALEVGITIQTHKAHENFFKLTLANKVVFVHGGLFPTKVTLGRFTENKDVTKLILRENDVPVPTGFCATTEKESLKLIATKQLKFPLVVKPLDGYQAIGVTCNITNEQELIGAIRNLKKAQEKYNSLKKESFVIEEMVQGEEYRVLVLGDKMISCVKKLPATIVGDGKSSVRELVAEQNKNRLEGFHIQLDEIAKNTLERLGYTVDSTIPESEKIILREDMLLRNGGRVIDCTHLINDNVQQQCVKALQSIGFDYGGIDVISEDITKSDSFKILEINLKPAHIINEKPLVEGKGVDVSLLLLQHVFPELNK